MWDWALHVLAYSPACNREKKASNRYILLAYIVMVHLSSLEDIYNHTKYTEEILTGINPQAVNWNCLSFDVWIIIITMIFPTVFQRFFALWLYFVSKIPNLLLILVSYRDHDLKKHCTDEYFSNRYSRTLFGLCAQENLTNITQNRSPLSPLWRP